MIDPFLPGSREVTRGLFLTGATRKKLFELSAIDSTQSRRRPAAIAKADSSDYSSYNISSRQPTLTRLFHR